MPHDLQSFILQFLNSEPFNLNLSPLQFDQLPPQQLLQTLSNVLRCVKNPMENDCFSRDKIIITYFAISTTGFFSWICDSERVDIKRETAEETAIRILSLLRVLRYRPPQDQEEQ